MTNKIKETRIIINKAIISHNNCKNLKESETSLQKHADLLEKLYQEPILYTEEEIFELIQNYLGDLSSCYKEIPFDKWFEQNKKKQI